MTSGYLTALIAFGGSVITGFISFFAAWFIQRRNESAESKIAERRRRQNVYKRFIEEAARLYADALAKSTFDTAVLVSIYALVGQMRILSSGAVVGKASSVIETIVDAYFKPNQSPSEVRPVIHSHKFDLLQGFSEACREELDGI
jgi:hypothetical protein